MKNKILHIKNWMQQNKKTVLVLFCLKLVVKAAILGAILFTSIKCSAQSANTLLREGNKYYQKGKYNNATESYSKALQKAPKDIRAAFNQADALYKLNELDKAKDIFNGVAKASTNTDIQAKAFYNIGNIHYKQEKWEESAKAYKESLKRYPKDEDAKYNLMMALAKIKKNGGGGKDKQQQQNKDQKQDKQQQQQGQNKQQQQQQQQQQGQNKQQQQQQQQQQGQNKQQGQQQQQGQMSKEEAQKLLEAIGAEEGKVQQKLTKEKGKPQNTKIQKDW